MLHFTVISLGVGTNTSSRSVSPHGYPEQRPVIVFNQKHFPFSWQTRTYGSRLVSSEIRPRAADWHLNNSNNRSVCVFMNCSDSVSPDEEALREEGMSSLLKSILTHLGQGSAHSQKPEKAKPSDVHMFKPTEQTYTSKLHQTQNLIVTTQIH